MPSRVGRLYALNVAGAIVGALAGGFVLLPWLGSKWSLVALAVAVRPERVHSARRPRRRHAQFTVASGASIVAFVAALVLLPDPMSATIGRGGTAQVNAKSGAMRARRPRCRILTNGVRAHHVHRWRPPGGRLGADGGASSPHWTPADDAPPRAARGFSWSVSAVERRQAPSASTPAHHSTSWNCRRACASPPPSSRT